MLRQALAQFPFPPMAARVLAAYFVPGGKPPAAPLKLTPMPTLRPRRELVELTVIANFVEVFLAKDGHSGPVGVNYLVKIQLPTLASLYGAMLAGVDYVLMGAGIPRAIPAVLDHFAAGEPAELTLDVAGALAGEKFVGRFDPRDYLGDAVQPLKRHAVPGHRLVVDPGAHARAQEQWTSRRLRRARSALRGFAGKLVVFDRLMDALAGN